MGCSGDSVAASVDTLTLHYDLVHIALKNDSSETLTD